MDPIMRFVDRATRSVPDDLAASIRQYVQAKFASSQQTVIDYGPYNGWDHSHYACDVHRPASLDPEFLVLMEKVSALYHQDVLEFAQAFERSVRENEHDPAQASLPPDERLFAKPVNDIRLVSAFATRYLPGNKRFDDHDDRCDVSLVVELSDSDYEGGGVVGADSTPWRNVRLDRRERGSAVIIGREVLHKTIPMTSGIRWALVFFYAYT